MATAAVETPTMTRTAARRLTALIKRQLGDVQQRTETLAESVQSAYRDGAWQSLGYGTWEDYLAAEFPELGHGQRYRLVAWGSVVGELEAATGGPVDVSGRQAVEAKRRNPSKVADSVRRRLADKAEPTAEDRRAAVAAALAEPIDTTAKRVDTPGEPPPVPRADSDVEAPLAARARAVERTEPAPAAVEPVVSDPAPVSAAAAVLALLDVDPRTANLEGVTPDMLDRLAAWTGTCRLAVNERRREMANVGRTAPRAKNKPAAATVKAADPAPAAVSGCHHPVNRRLGNVCAACGVTVK